MSTVSIDIRLAGMGDAAGIADVHDVSWRHAYTGILPYRALDTMIRRRGTEWWKRALRHSTRILVVEFDDEIVGYATLGPNRVRSLPGKGEVFELYIRPEFQGVGFGRKLFLAARQELLRMGLPGCIVWALADNHNAVQFYTNAGGDDIAEDSEVFDGQRLLKIAFAWDRVAGSSDKSSHWDSARSTKRE